MPDMDLGGFIDHLAGAVAHLEHAEHHAMEQAAVLVEHRAKEILGHYQDQAGPFSAWAPLTEKTQEDRVAKGYPADEPLLRDGTLRDSIEHHVEGREAVIGSNSEIAEYQELGTAKMAPRSFLGAAAVQTGPKVAEIVGAGTVKALVGEAVFRQYFPIP